MRKIIWQRFLPQKIDTRVLQYSLLFLLLVYGLYNVWFSIEETNRQILDHQTDILVVFVVAVVAPLFFVSILLLLINFLHSRFEARFEERFRARKYALLSLPNWLFAGLIQAFVISANWLVFFLPSLFSQPNLFNVLMNSQVSLADRLYLASPIFIWFFMFLGVIFVFRLKTAGLYLLLTGCVLSGLGALKRALELESTAIGVFDVFRPSFSILLSFLLIFLTYRALQRRSAFSLQKTEG